MKKISDSVLSFFLLCIIVVLAFFSPVAKSGAIEGINLCENIIIPSLLPILILSNTITRMNSGKTSFAVFFGLISGFPAGAILTNELYKRGCISEKKAERIMCFNFSGGIAFIISALGSVIYKSTKAGVILFISCVLSSLIIALITKPFYRDERDFESYSSKLKFSSAISESAEISVKSLAVMSAYIILFSSLLSLVSIPDYLIPLLEITNGICKAEKLIPLPFCAFFLSFGGLCIHLQLIPFLSNMKIRYHIFLFFRLLSASLSFFICKILLHFIPDALPASVSLSPSLPFEMSKLGGGLSMVMIIGCAVVVFDLENRKLQLNK